MHLIGNRPETVHEKCHGKPGRTILAIEQVVVAGMECPAPNQGQRYGLLPAGTTGPEGDISNLQPGIAVMAGRGGQ